MTLSRFLFRFWPSVFRWWQEKKRTSCPDCGTKGEYTFGFTVVDYQDCDSIVFEDAYVCPKCSRAWASCYNDCELDVVVMKLWEPRLRPEE